MRMERIGAPLLAAALALLAGVQVFYLLRDGASVERVPIFTPSSYGSSAVPTPALCAAAERALSPDARALAAKLPMTELLAGLARLGEDGRPGLAAARDEAVKLYKELLDLRNRRHAWNVQTMELAVELTRTLTPGQLRQVLSNRDRREREQLEAAGGAAGEPPVGP